MKKMKRAPVIREVLEGRLKKNERRIQAIAEESYKLRQMIEQIDALKPQTPYVKPAEPTANEQAIELDKQIDAVMDAEDKAIPSTTIEGVQP